VGKVDRGTARLTIYRDPCLDLATVIHRIDEMAVVQTIEDAADLLLRIVLDVPHVGLNDLQAKELDDPMKLGHTLLIGRDLRLQIGDVLIDVARWVFGGGEELP